ncbi:MAG: cytochrome c [Bacteroidota bacterium]
MRAYASWFACVFCYALLCLPACGEPNFNQGQSLYQQHCAGCHMDEGQGLGRLYPPLAGSDWLIERRVESICAIRYGLEGEIYVNDTMYNQVMLGIKDLSEVQITNIMNYINTSWGNDFPLFTVQEVKSSLEDCR